MYYGEEIGMTNTDPTRLEDVRDVVGKKGWPKVKGRDGERTPMQWNDTINFGFNTGAKTWLPVSPSYKTVNVALEDKDPNSLLNWYRSLIALRRTIPALFEGEYLPLNTTDVNVLSYMREEGKSRVLVTLNMSGSEQTVTFDPQEVGTAGEHILLSSATQSTTSLRKVTIEPYGVFIAELR